MRVLWSSFSAARVLALASLVVTTQVLIGQTGQQGTEPAPSSPDRTSSTQQPASQSKPAAPKAAEKLEPQEPSPLQPDIPQQPKTEILDTSSTAGALATDGHDPILDPPPLPAGITTMAGGVIADVDRIRNHLTLNIFGGGRWTVFFDERTHIFRNGAEVTQLALKKGERVYVDTMLDNNGRDVFARNIRVGLVTRPADTEGQIVEVDTRHSELAIRDNINSTSVRFGVDQNTKIRNGASAGGSAASFGDLRRGALVRVKFSPERPNRGLASEIEILASPGAAFTFLGQVTFLDTHRGALAVRNAADNKTYDLHFSPRSTPGAANLAVGDEVKIIAVFNGAEYSAREISVVRTPAPAK